MCFGRSYRGSAPFNTLKDYPRSICLWLDVYGQDATIRLGSTPSAVQMINVRANLGLRPVGRITCLTLSQTPMILNLIQATDSPPEHPDANVQRGTQTLRLFSCRGRIDRSCLILRIPRIWSDISLPEVYNG